MRYLVYRQFLVVTTFLSAVADASVAPAGKSGRSLRVRLPFNAPAIVIALTCLLATVAYAQNETALPPNKLLSQLRLDTWGIRDGLPGYDLTSLVQTPDGYLWIGSTQGLIRFDGATFTVFNSSNLPGLTNSTIRALSIDGRGNLLVGAEWCAYGDVENGVYKQHYVESGNPWNATHYFHLSPDGTLWIGYQGWNFLLRERSGTVERIDIHGVYLAGAVDLPGGDLLIGMNFGGLYRIHDGKPTPFKTDAPLASNDITAMIPGRDGVIWIGTDSTGLYQLKGNHLTHISTSNGLHSNTIRCLCLDGGGRLWVGTNSGIDSLGTHGWEHFGVAEGLANDNVTAILSGREGNIWVANGIFLSRFADTHLTPISLGPVSVRDTFGINVGHDGSLYCGTRGGLWQFPAKANTLPRQLTHSIATNAVEARNGDLIVWSPISLTKYVIERHHNGISQKYVVDFPPIKVVDTGKELDVYGQTAEYQRLPQDKVKRDLAPDHPNLVVYDIKNDGRGNTWFGTTSGLTRLQNGRLVVVDVGLPDGAHVLSIDVSDPKYLWLGTDRGLARVDRATLGHATVYTAKDGLPSSEFLQLIRDDSGAIWLGGYFGICSVRSADLFVHDRNPRMVIPVHLYTAADGVRFYPYVAIPAKTPDGTVWFIGHSGLTKIEPNHIPVNALRPPVVIEDAVANGVSLRTDGSLNKVRPGAGSLMVHYAGLSFTQPEKVRFRYKLVGFEKSWVDAGARRMAAYTNLPPGRYTFEVLACNNDGVWSVTGASVSFDLAPHFYETGWFKTLVAVACIIFIGMFIRLRTRAIALRARELEGKVEQRTAELSDANQRLLSNQAEIEAQNDELQTMQAELEAQNDELMKTQEHLAKANERLAALATTDGLTGLFNHRTFHARLEEEWARHIRYGTALSLILIDVDKFKQFNDTYGHPAGDEVLRTVSRILKETVRGADIVARYGGEEFVVIAPETDKRYALKLAERLRKSIESAEWPQRLVTGSFGVATAGARTTEPSELVTEADTALYRSKNNGRNQVTHFETVQETPSQTVSA